jgi:hypothetical protein
MYLSSDIIKKYQYNYPAELRIDWFKASIHIFEGEMELLKHLVQI